MKTNTLEIKITNVKGTKTRFFLIRNICPIYRSGNTKTVITLLNFTPNTGQNQKVFLKYHCSKVGRKQLLYVLDSSQLPTPPPI